MNILWRCFFEIASPILKGRKISNKRDVSFIGYLKQFDESGQEANAGLHVHHDIKDILDLEKDSKKLLSLIYHFQTLCSLIEDWRDESEYCMKPESEKNY